MLSGQFFVRYLSLLIIVEMKESFAQFTTSENLMPGMCSQAPTFESGHSVISDQIQTQNKILEKLAESIQTAVQTEMHKLSQKFESNLNDLSQVVESNMKNLSREVESKLESVQFGYSELKSEIEQLRNLTTNCSTVQTTEVFILF